MVWNHLLEYLLSTDVILWSVENFYLFILKNLPHVCRKMEIWDSKLSVLYVYCVIVDRNMLDDMLYVDYNSDMFSNYYNHVYHSYNWVEE
jgi:hypothetical protein